MTDPRIFRTLRGFLKGYEPEEEIYFAHSASLRIFGNIPDLDQITVELGIVPTSSHRAGDRRGPNSPPYKEDMWRFSPDVPEEEPLEHHVDALWKAIQHKRDDIRALKRTLTVDVFLGYRSNSDTAGVEVPHTCLKMFTELEVPFGLSIIVT